MHSIPDYCRAVLAALLLLAAIAEAGAIETKAGIGVPSGGAPAGFLGRDDFFELMENGGETRIDVLRNDSKPQRESLVGGRLEISEPPAHGSVRVDTNGTLGDARDDVFHYTPPADWSGRDAFGYRVCTTDNACYEALVSVRVWLLGWGLFQQSGTAGASFASMSGLRELSNLRFVTTPMVTAQKVALLVDADPDAMSPWDQAGAGTETRFFEVPGTEQRTDWQILVRSTTFGGPSDLYVGFDDDGDGVADADEVRCTFAMYEIYDVCELATSHVGPGVKTYWAMVHNRNVTALDVDLQAAAVPMVPGDGSLLATGPVRAAAGATMNWVVSFNKPLMPVDTLAVGYLRLFQDGVELDRSYYMAQRRRDTPISAPTVLSPGKPMTLRLDVGESQGRLFIDVPAGARQMTVTTRSEGEIDLFLATLTQPADEAKIAWAPGRDEARAAATGAGGNEVLVIDGPELTPGRWYITPVNAGDDAAEVTVEVTITTNQVPVVRPGSYFNGARTGHGVFLYPAGSQWAGLWYTYSVGSRPTWYYIQGPAPGDDGVFRGDLFHSVWLGDRNRLTRIGAVAVTPTGDDRFIFTHEVHSLVGSQPMAALGRGCPRLGGVPVDSSSNWFDPTKAGTGYSVQFWENYEYYAAFVYDEFGEARYLSAESPGFAGREAVLELQQLRGTPPISFYPGPPARFKVGTLRRTISNGQVSRIVIDASFVEGVPGTWFADDVLQPLGGPGTTQGCAP